MQRYQVREREDSVSYFLIKSTILLAKPSGYSLTGFFPLQEFKTALKEDTIDFSAYTANIKRKRPTPRKGVKYGRIPGADDEDDSDEDWAGGSRKLSSSSRRGNSTRGSRLR